MRPTLRPYQVDALDAIEDALDRGVDRQLLALPTGTGKTVVFAELIRRRGGRALVLVHRDELVSQAIRHRLGDSPRSPLGTSISPTQQG